MPQATGSDDRETRVLGVRRCSLRSEPCAHPPTHWPPRACRYHEASFRLQRISLQVLAPCRSPRTLFHGTPTQRCAAEWAPNGRDARNRIHPFEKRGVTHPCVRDLILRGPSISCPAARSVPLRQSKSPLIRVTAVMREEVTRLHFTTPTPPPACHRTAKIRPFMRPNDFGISPDLSKSLMPSCRTILSPFTKEFRGGVRQ